MDAKPAPAAPRPTCKSSHPCRPPAWTCLNHREQELLEAAGGAEALGADLADWIRWLASLLDPKQTAALAKLLRRNDDLVDLFVQSTEKWLSADKREDQANYLYARGLAKNALARARERRK